MTELSHLEGAFFMVVFITGFTGALVIGILIHDFLDKNRRLLRKMLQNLKGKPPQ